MKCNYRSKTPGLYCSYFEHMDRICSPQYCPSNIDVLRARVRTQGIIETCFKISGMIFR